MVMSRMHLPGQIQLPVSPSLTLQDMGDQKSLGMSAFVCLEDIKNRNALRSGVRRTSQLQLTPGNGNLFAVV